MSVKPYTNNQEFFSLINKIDNMEEKMIQHDSQELDALVGECKKYDVFDFISRLSSLNLLVENQNKSILFDMLIGRLLCEKQNNFTGAAIMSHGKFRSLVNRLAQLEIRHLVDPPENPFIQRVLYYGNYWVFPGINYSPVETIQGFINVLCHGNLSLNSSFKIKSHRLIDFILKLSDTMAQELDLDENSICCVNQNEIEIPNAQKMLKLQSCVNLNLATIKGYLPDEDIQEPLFSGFNERGGAQVFDVNWQDFFAHPFLKTPDNHVIVLNPSILVSFLVHRLILLADSYGIKEKFVDAYNNEIWSHCKRDLHALGHKTIQSELYGIDLVNDTKHKEEILTVGNNKLLFVQFICDDGYDYCEGSMFNPYPIDLKGPYTYTRTKYFVEKLSPVTEDDVYQIIILNAFGRTTSIGLDRAERPYTIFLSPFELHCVAINEKDRKEFLPRYINAKKRIKAFAGMPVSSELNAIEMYTQYGYSFYLSDDFQPQNTIVTFGLDSSVEYVIKALKRENSHLVNFYDGTHLKEVVLSDPERNIYFSKNNPQEICIKFNRLTLWITSDDVRNNSKLQIYSTLLDTISYWLAEESSVINKIAFVSDCICLDVAINTQPEEYFKPVEDSPREIDLSNSIHFTRTNNIVKMVWTPRAFQMLGKETNNVEKEMTKLIIKFLGSISTDDLDLMGFDLAFENPLKKKVYVINTTKTPSLLPTGKEIVVVSEEETNELLDSIGEYFLASPDYTYGKVPDEKRVALGNQVVGYLYSLLKEEVASLSPDGVYEQICSDLETVAQQLLMFQGRFSYDCACYPEKISKLTNQYNEINRVSMALKFFAEYIAATPPAGEIYLGTMQYDRIIAICSLIVEWAYKNDLFQYNIVKTPVEFLRSKRIGMPKDEQVYHSRINQNAISKQLLDVSDPRIALYFPTNLFDDFNSRIDDAFQCEYGFTFQQFTACIKAIESIGIELPDEAKRRPRLAVIDCIAKDTEISIPIIEKVLEQITLCQREDFLVPPSPYKPYDVYPWRFNRELSLVRRPIIRYQDDLIWGNRQLHHMWAYVVDLIVNGKYKAKSAKLKQLIGKLSDKRGDEFNSAVAKKLSEISGLIVKEKVKKINGKKIADMQGNVLGDIDILYIVPELGKIVVGEVKDFSFAKNPYEMNQEYKRIFVDGDKQCFMTKHKRRAHWVQEHLEDVIQHFQLPNKKWCVRTTMFVSEAIISNEFYHQNESIIVYSEITEEKIKAV